MTASTPPPRAAIIRAQGMATDLATYITQHIVAECDGTWLGPTRHAAEVAELTAPGLANCLMTLAVEADPRMRAALDPTKGTRT